MATEKRRMIDSLVYYHLGRAQSLMERAQKRIEARVPSKPAARSQVVSELLEEMKGWSREVKKLINESLLEEREGK